MTTSSPIEKAIQQIIARGWLLAGLERSYFDSAHPWTAEVYPGHLGGLLHRGTRSRSPGGYTVLVNGMTTVMGDGATAVEALRAVIFALDNSEVKEVYDRFQKALEDWLDATTQATRNS